MKKLLLAAAAALLAFAACNREPAFTDPASREIRFTSNIENTFAVKSLEPLAVGRTVRIFAGAPIDANTEATAADGNKLTPATVLKWNANQTATTTFVGLYPSDQTATTVEGYKLVGDGNVQDFEYQNNFLAAVAKDVQPGSVVNLAFKHPFVKVVVDITNQLTGTPEVTGVTFKEVYTEATLDFAAGTVTPAASKGEVIATKNATTGKFEAIIMPQTSVTPVLVVSVGATTYTFKINAATTFVAGKSYTATLTLKDSTPPVVEGEEVSFGFTVSDWETDATPIATTEITEQWSVVGDVAGGWDKDIVMVEGATAGVLEANITYKAGNEFKLRLAEGWDVSAGMKAGVAYVGDSAWDGHLDQTDNNIKLEAAGEYKITFRPADWLFTATKTGDVTPDPSATTGKLTFNVYNAAAWESMTFYGWEEADPWPKFAGDWPGTAPAATDIIVNGNAFKSFVLNEVPLNNDNLFYLLYGGDDGHKTINLKLPVVLTEAETTVYVLLKASKEVELITDITNFVPPAAPTGDSWAVIGLAGAWSTDHAMTQDATDPNCYTITITLGSGNEGDGFKFRANGSWDKQFGIDPTLVSGTDSGLVIDGSAQNGTTPIQLVENNPSSKNIILTPDACQYTLKLYVAGDKKGELYITKL